MRLAKVGKMSRRLICLIALVMVISADFCSANSFWGNRKEVKPITILKDVSDVPIRYKPEEIYELLGTRLCFAPKGQRGPDAIDVLAATDDKLRPNTILGKYSINDLLSMNEVYESDFTPETFRDKLALCESLKPSEDMRPESGPEAFLVDRKPSDYVFRKNLYDYCAKAFELYHYTMRRDMRVNDELDTKVKRLEAEVDRFLEGYPGRYRYVAAGHEQLVSKMMEDFLKGKQPDEVIQIKAMCKDLIDKVGFVEERELLNFRLPPNRYKNVFSYCKRAAELSM